MCVVGGGKEAKVAPDSGYASERQGRVALLYCLQLAEEAGIFTVITALISHTHAHKAESRLLPSPLLPSCLCGPNMEFSSQ